MSDEALLFSLPNLLRQPQEKIRALQDRLLRETIELCYRSHPYYSKLMRREGLEPRHIQNCDDLRRLPPTSKHDFLADPDAFRVNPEDLPPEQGTLWKVIYTTGTTSGKPAPIYVAAHDHFAYLYVCATRQELIGLNSNDRTREPVSPHLLPDGSLCESARRNSGSRSVDFLRPDRPFRFIFSCPPHSRRGCPGDRTPSRDCIMGHCRFCTPGLDARTGTRRRFLVGSDGDDHRRSVIICYARRLAPAYAEPALCRHQDHEPLRIDGAGSEHGGVPRWRRLP